MDHELELIKSMKAEKLRESLYSLRIGIKYLFFDLEATRRECTYLKKCLEECLRNQDNRYNGQNPQL